MGDHRSCSDLATFDFSVVPCHSHDLAADIGENLKEIRLVPQALSIYHDSLRCIIAEAALQNLGKLACLKTAIPKHTGNDSVEKQTAKGGLGR